MATVVICCTSGAFLGSHPTGLWMEELAAPYYKLKDAGFTVILASTKGGPVPIDGASMGEGFFTDAARKFMSDGTAIGELSHTLAIGTVDLGAVSALLMPGGHGTAVDFPEDADLKKAIETMYGAGKVVATVCHGPICLAQCKKPDGSPLVAGLSICGFTNTEEAAVGLTSAVPFLIEDKLQELGGKWERADDWNSKVTVDSSAATLICGQNPQSSEGVADAIIEVLKGQA